MFKNIREKIVDLVTGNTSLNPYKILAEIFEYDKNKTPADSKMFDKVLNKIFSGLTAKYNEIAINADTLKATVSDPSVLRNTLSNSFANLLNNVDVTKFDILSELNRLFGDANLKKLELITDVKNLIDIYENQTFSIEEFKKTDIMDNALICKKNTSKPTC